MPKSGSDDDTPVSGATPAMDDESAATGPDVTHSDTDGDSIVSNAQDSPSHGPEIRRQTKSWIRIGLPGAAVLIALIALLFGDNLILRVFQSEPSVERRFYATYSFKKHPYVHPKIIGDLIGRISDQGDQVVSINLLDSQNSNRYFGEISLAPQTDSPGQSWPWVYSAERKLIFSEAPSDYWGIPFDAYRYLGSTQNGLDVLHAKWSGGGAGVFDRLVFVRIEPDHAVDYPLLSDLESSQHGTAEPELRNRELIKIVGKIPLGDRWFGTVEIVGNDVVVRGRDLEERCRLGGVTELEAVEMNQFRDVVCKEGEPDEPPSARVYEAPVPS